MVYFLLDLKFKSRDKSDMIEAGLIL